MRQLSIGEKLQAIKLLSTRDGLRAEDVIDIQSWAAEAGARFDTTSLSDNVVERIFTIYHEYYH